jgi:hypothetical protein
MRKSEDPETKTLTVPAWDQQGPPNLMGAVILSQTIWTLLMLVQRRNGRGRRRRRG